MGLELEATLMSMTTGAWVVLMVYGTSMVVMTFVFGVSAWLDRRDRRRRVEDEYFALVEFQGFRSEREALLCMYAVSCGDYKAAVHLMRFGDYLPMSEAPPE